MEVGAPKDAGKPLIPVVSQTLDDQTPEFSGENASPITNERVKASDEAWKEVSPTKAGRSRVSTSHEHSKSLVSPSRYSLLEVEDESREPEEGEIESKEKTEEITETLQSVEKQETRPSFPRVSKTMHKVIPDSKAQSTKIIPSVSSKRGRNRKN